MSERKRWWGVVKVPGGRSARWRLGPLELIARRRAGELQLGITRHPDSANGNGWERSEGEESPESLDRVERFIVHGTESEVELLPALADRPVVTSPRVALTILPDEEAVLLVGSPLWVRLSAGSPRVALTELPVRRPSDTWFGPSTREGELCYGTTTRAILRSENLPLLAGRAVTPVRIRNLAAEPLPLERLKLPVPRLSLYADERGLLWTDRIVLVRQAAEEVAAVRVEEGAPEEAGEGAVTVSPPRETVAPGALERVFGSLLRRLEGDE
ncbi:MAG: hypothetical protein R3325_05345 [Thermoanaerobaculia bacterium]|nr:hypothetical protein [Thermoanaerobaculia bacterium]